MKLIEILCNFMVHFADILNTFWRGILMEWNQYISSLVIVLGLSRRIILQTRCQVCHFGSWCQSSGLSVAVVVNVDAWRWSRRRQNAGQQLLKSSPKKQRSDSPRGHFYYLYIFILTKLVLSDYIISLAKFKYFGI